MAKLKDRSRLTGRYGVAFEGSEDAKLIGVKRQNLRVLRPQLSSQPSPGDVRQRGDAAAKSVESCCGQAGGWPQRVQEQSLQKAERIGVRVGAKAGDPPDNDLDRVCGEWASANDERVSIASRDDALFYEELLSGGDKLAAELVSSEGPSRGDEGSSEAWEWCGAIRMIEHDPPSDAEPRMQGAVSLRLEADLEPWLEVKIKSEAEAMWRRLRRRHR